MVRDFTYKKIGKTPYIKNGNKGVYFYLRCKYVLCGFGYYTRIHFHSKNITNPRKKHSDRAYIGEIYYVGIGDFYDNVPMAAYSPNKRRAFALVSSAS